MIYRQSVTCAQCLKLFKKTAKSYQFKENSTEFKQWKANKLPFNKKINTNNTTKLLPPLFKNTYTFCVLPCVFHLMYLLIKVPVLKYKIWFTTSHIYTRKREHTYICFISYGRNNTTVKINNQTIIYVLYKWVTMETNTLQCDTIP